MSSKNVVAFLLWNLLLTGLVIWLLVGRKGTGGTSAAVAVAPSDSSAVTPVMRDTAALRSGRIAFFFMDTLMDRYELVAEKDKHVKSYGRNMEADLKSAYDKAAAEAAALQKKDHTYSTQAEVDADRRRLMELQQGLQGQEADSQNRIEQARVDAQVEIVNNIRNFLEEYNKAGQYDYIISVQDGGQVWVGNKGLDITSDIVEGLNARYRATKAAPAKK